MVLQGLNIFNYNHVSSSLQESLYLTDEEKKREGFASISSANMLGLKDARALQPTFFRSKMFGERRRERGHRSILEQCHGERKTFASGSTTRGNSDCSYCMILFHQ